MQTNAELMRRRAEELLAEGAVDRVLGWKKGDFFYDPSPAYFHSAAQLEDFTYDRFCAANLSKYLADRDAAPAKTLVFLKPCDTYSFNQLLSEHKIDRTQVHVVGVGCDGMLDIRKIREKGVRAPSGVSESDGEISVKSPSGDKAFPAQELLLEKCATCKSRKHAACDELIPADIADTAAPGERFREVELLEAMTPEARYDFWRNELSKCIRCNACRNACPACTCIQCVFDNSRSGVSTKASSDSFEDSMYHIIRAFHVAGRCTDCGECSRACPQGIPLHLLNRKIIKDINSLYGEYQAGESEESRSPLVSYAVDDAEPGIVGLWGGMK